MTPHEAAQSLWWFVLFCFAVIGLAIYLDIKKEKRDGKASKNESR